jgi:hypothetical protein
MRHTLIIIILHIVHVAELGFRGEGVALVALVFFGGTCVQGEDVGLAVLGT